MTTMLASLSILGLVLPPWAWEPRLADVPRLSDKNGPFMVLASRFDGVDAERLAKCLAREFCVEHNIPSYVLGFRVEGHEGWLVLLGDARTADEARALLARVKALRPRAEIGTPPRAGLAGLVRTLLGRPKEPAWRPLATINPLVDPGDFYCTRWRTPGPRPPLRRYHPPFEEL